MEKRKIQIFKVIKYQNKCIIQMFVTENVRFLITANKNLIPKDFWKSVNMK